MKVGGEEARKNQYLAAVKAIEGIKPSDEIEGMLATQMVATHSAAMECLRRAMIPDQTFAGRDQSLKHATKLLSIYARQIETHNKHRGKGQQKVTVEYVNVEAGGQAVVGNVEPGGGSVNRGSESQPQQKSIFHNPGETIDVEPKKAAKPVKRKK
jgi:hypothetical protein